MNVTKPEKFKLELKAVILFGISILVCILIAIGIIVVQEKTEQSRLAFTNPEKAEDVELTRKTDDQIEALQTSFNKKFINCLEDEEEITDFGNKIDDEKSLVFTKLSIDSHKDNLYEVKCMIPNINIDKEIPRKINEEVESVFKEPIEEILKDKGIKISYSTDYVAKKTGNILSLMVIANLKEGSQAQKTTIKCYNYDIEQDKQISLSQYLNDKNVNAKVVQKSIEKEILKAQEKVESLENLGYSIYKREVGSSIYELENIKDFYISNNTIYIVFAYGNKENTSEMDIVVI